MSALNFGTLTNIKLKHNYPFAVNLLLNPYNKAIFCLISERPWRVHIDRKSHLNNSQVMSNQPYFIYIGDF
jgi:hypothetical protein